ncbi:hypothetical protein Poli38472_012951 [Pythium oligandrum]|uniref:Enoyl reductase (ER) domain-containing protein n=1 Tax=Pythium oligandrum TaxID=41045 RepID=A0A8K1CIR7_PYTOL|nr:hypothetical protein Poli38472_012951 [Pythium oligandrum]|eukprot:TMW64329.1 hypothetical protein Poli38472_012951 [Pythium oligandrum]
MAAIPATYRAYLHEGYGDLATELQLRCDVPQEILKTDQVRIQVHAAGLNPADYKIIEIGASFMPVSLSPEEPFRVGFDVAGVVAEVGSDVTSLKVGDEVLARGDFITRGSCAEYVVIDTKYIVQKPAKLSFQLAASLPVIGLTSYQALSAEGQLQKGERVLVLGGSSGTGVIAIQIAKLLGASFVAATTSTRNIDFVLSFGADRVIDYTIEKWAEVLEAHSIDLIYDCGVEPNAWDEGAQRVLKVNTGRLVTISREITPSESPIGATYIRFRKVPNSTDLALVTQWVESDQLRVPIDSVYAFEDLLNAFKAIKAGHTRGKVILEVITSKP